VRTRHLILSEPLAGSLGADDRDHYRLVSEVVFDGELASGRYVLEVFIEGSHAQRVGLVASRVLLEAAPFSTRCFLSLAARLTPHTLRPLREAALESWHGVRQARRLSATRRPAYREG
jgi:hypothetical protein